MEHIHPNRNWKYVHHASKQSNDSMNASFQSSHSNSSTKFNKFRFNRGDDSVASKPEQIFTFTSKTKNKPNDCSLLSKRSNKESDTSKKSDNEIALQGVSRPSAGKSIPGIPPSKQKGKSNEVKALLKQVKLITHNFKKAIEYFTRKLKELQIEWDSSFKQLLSQQIGQERETMKAVKHQIDMQQKKLSQFAKIELDKDILKNESSEKKQERHRPQPQIDIPPFKLAISKIQGAPQSAQIQNHANRNATLMSLLCQDFNPTPPSGDRGGRQMRSLRQTIKRMREVLDEQ